MQRRTNVMREKGRLFVIRAPQSLTLNELLRPPSQLGGVKPRSRPRTETFGTIWGINIGETKSACGTQISYSCTLLIVNFCFQLMKQLRATVPKLYAFHSGLHKFVGLFTKNKAWNNSLRELYRPN